MTIDEVIKTFKDKNGISEISKADWALLEVLHKMLIVIQDQDQRLERLEAKLKI